MTQSLITSLADSLRPLQQGFDAHTGKVRCVAIMSPT